MARSIWKGSISFGLVNIPVTLYSGEDRAEKLSFTMLDQRDMAPLGYKRVNKTTGEEVPWDDVVKGYEYEKGQFVLVDDEDFKKANPVATQTIEILDFVDGSEIDPSFFDKPYYLEPGKKGEKGYALLRETLKRSGKVGIAKVVVRTREYLAAVIARGPALVLEALRYGHELKDPGELDLPSEDLKKVGVTEKEVDMAGRLVDGMVSGWEPGKYRDEYTDQMLALIKRKARDGEVESIEAPVDAAPAGEVVDFMALLKKSLDAKAKRSGGKAAQDEDAPAAKGSRRAGAVKMSAEKGKSARKKTAGRKSA